MSRSKTFYTIIGTVPAIVRSTFNYFDKNSDLSIAISVGYFGQSFWNKYNVFSKNPDQNKDYIDLDESPFDYSVNEDSDDAIASGHKTQSSTTHLKLLGLSQIKRDPVISELAISAIASSHFDGKF